MITCGTDIIEIYRIKEAIEDMDDKFIKRIYTQNEIDYCESKKNAKYQHYSARFAAKEAVFKAISKEVDNKFSISWCDIEILNCDSGRPYAKILNHDFPIKEIDVSLSHCKEYAVANVVVEWE